LTAPALSETPGFANYGDGATFGGVLSRIFSPTFGRLAAGKAG